MIATFFKFLMAIIGLALLISCAFLTIFAGVIVIAATDISAWDRFMALVAALFFGFMSIILIETAGL